MNYQLIHPGEDSAYESYLNNFEDRSVFNHWDWAWVLEKSYGFIPYTFALRENGICRGLICVMETRGIFGGRRGVSLPFSDFCEPLVASPEDFKSGFEEVKKIARKRKWKFIEIRGGDKYLGHEPEYSSMYTHDIDLSGSEESIFKKFRNSTRRNIIKAEKSPLKIAHSTSSQVLRDFYRLNCQSRKEKGIPPQPFSFFQYFAEKFLKKGRGFITTASLKGQIIACNIYLINGEKAVYKYGAANRQFQEYRPSNLIMWEGLKKCRNLGCNQLNLGRTEPGHSGLLQFKRGFGCVENLLKYFRFNMDQNRFIANTNSNGAGISSRIFSRMPIPALKLTGTLLYRYVF